MLDAITLSRYRAFARPERFEVRPLTILIGPNNAGKSALARLPILLSRAFAADARGALELDAGGLDFGGSLLDLVHGRSVHGHLEMGVEVSNPSGLGYSWRTRLQYYDEYLNLLVQRLSVEASDGRSVTLSCDDPDPRASVQMFESSDGSVIELSLAGLTASVFDESAPPLLQEATDAIRSALGRTRYLGPFRERPRRDYTFPSSRPFDVGALGQTAAAILGEDALRGTGDIVRAVQAFFDRSLGAGTIDVDRIGDRFALVLREPTSGAAINLVDTGAGLGQILPVTVQRAVDAHGGRPAHVEVVEQPELHLHPRAHGDVADLYVDAIRGGCATRFIVETHAENFVLRVRRRIAEGRIDPDAVRIYWIKPTGDGARLLPITVDRDGEVDQWPQGVFSEDFEEAKALARARVHPQP